MPPLSVFAFIPDSLIRGFSFTVAMDSLPQASEPHAFVEEELVRALTEQSFGIASYEVVSTSPMKATALVVLLEGESILVSLTSRGYQVSPWAVEWRT